MEVAFNQSEPRTDRPEISALPYTAHVETKEEKKAAFGDVPDVGLLIEKRKEIGKEYISQIGEATLRNAARIIGHDPDKVPDSAGKAREWLDRHFKHGGVLK